MKRARIFGPLFASMVTIFVLQSTASAKSSSIETCFQNQNGSIGKLSMDSKVIDLRWDIDDFTEISSEIGKVSDYKFSSKIISGTAVMIPSSEFESRAASESAARLQISVSKAEVVFQEMSAQKEALSAEQRLVRVSCPEEASPLALELE